MGVIEKSIALTSKDGEGNQLLFLPYTKVDNVEGAIDEAQLQNYVTNQDLEGKGYLDTTTADGKYLLKTGKAENAKNADESASVVNEYTNISNDGNSSFAKGKLTINGTNGNFTTSGSIDSKFLKITNSNGEMAFAVDSNGAIRALKGVFAVTVGGNVTANLFNNVSLNKDSENIVVGGIVLNDLAAKTELNEYVTETELSAKNYATTSQLPSVMVGATSALVGSEGLVPAPAKGFQARFLRGDGTWETPTDSKTQQTKKTDNNEYPILAKLTANGTNATAGASFASGITINPSTRTITANTFNGTATKAIVADAADSVNWSGVQNKPTIPTKVSQLTNDSGFLTSIPSEYITEIELNEKGFLTNVDLLPYAKTETVNQLLNQKVSTSEMINYVTYDSLSKQGFITKDDLPSKFIVSIEIQGNKLICHFNDLTSSEFELYKTGTEAPVWK